MAEIVNLRQARKRRDRQAREAAADKNRVRHGQTKQDKTRMAGEQATADARLDAHRLDRTHRVDREGAPQSDGSS